MSTPSGVPPADGPSARDPQAGLSTNADHQREGTAMDQIQHRLAEPYDYDDEGFLRPGREESQTHCGYVIDLPCCDHCGWQAHCDRVEDCDNEGHFEWRCAECAS